MNRHLTFVLILVTLLMVTGCRHEQAVRYRIGISQCSSDPWRWQTNDEIEREMLFHDSIAIDIRSADDLCTRQIGDIRDFIDKGYDLILVNPIEADSITPIIREAYRKGIPVVTFDRRIEGDSYTAHIEVDNEAIGRNAADYAAGLFSSHEKIKILELQGTRTMTPAQLRHKGFAERLSQYPNMEIIASPYANWNPDSAAVITDLILSRHPDIDLIYAHSDPMAISAVETAHRKGLNKVKAIGIDGLREVGIKAVADSVLSATFLYPTYGYRLARTAVDILKGNPITRNELIPPVSPVEPRNADIILGQEDKQSEETEKITLLKQMLDVYGSRQAVQTAILYASIIFVVLLLGVIFLLIRAYWSHRQHNEILTHKNQELEEEHRKQRELYARLDEATKSKLIFFTNVSHDLRTPLSLIEEPVARVEKSPRIDQHESYLLKLASKNIRILRRLIDQILDFRKFENGRLSLHITEEDLPALIREWSQGFQERARGKDIRCVLRLPENPVRIAIDAEKMERVFFNLISNSLKFTPANGQITVTLSAEDDQANLLIEDTGCGISAEDLPRVFDRFYQADRISPQGSGIGLAVCKAFVDLHGGTIKIESAPAEGTRITITLPATHAAEKASAPRLAEHSVSEQPKDEAMEIPLPVNAVSYDDSRPLILAIDDNTDLLALIRELLGESYNVLTATSAERGIRLAVKYTPDLILCDVMMPGTDGLECCRILKKELATSHIPVMMLTACALDEQRVQGYESGADAYMSKPFSADVLAARCRNLIENRKRILSVSRSPLQSGREETSPVASEINTLDNDFYARVCDLIRARIADPDLSVEELASATGLGHSQFTRKVKAITNYTPVELIRRFRVEKARKLLLSTDKTVGEIAAETGFSSQGYFTRCFRAAFGRTPSEVRTNPGD